MLPPLISAALVLCLQVPPEVQQGLPRQVSPPTDQAVESPLQRELETALVAGRGPGSGLLALDEHLAFERALATALNRPGSRAPLLLEELLASSPLRVPRSFTDGRTPTGWDLLQDLATHELASRRPDLGAALDRSARLLSPDVWQVREGLDVLAALVEDGGDEPAVSALLFQTADRLAPFPQYHELLAPVLARAVEQAPDDHQRRLAELRLAWGGPGRARGPEAATLWEAAVRSAPTPLVAELAELAAATAAGRSSDDAWRAAARERLGRLARDADHAEVAERALVRRALSAPDPLQAWDDLLALADLGAAPERLDGLLLVLVRDRPLPFDGPALDRLQTWTAPALARAAEADQRPCLLWVAAELARDRQRLEAAAPAGGSGLPRPDEADHDHDHDGPDDEHLDEEARALLVEAAAPALAGAVPRPVLAPRSEWWLPLDEPPERSLRPVEYARAACWSLAADAWARQDWPALLTYGAVPVPARGCGNAAAASERLRLSRLATAHEALGRLDEALALHVQLLGLASPPDEQLLAAFDLAAFTRRHGALEPAVLAALARPGAAAAPAELCRRLLVLGRLLDEGQQDRATAAAAETVPLLGGHPALTARLSAWLSGER